MTRTPLRTLALSAAFAASALAARAQMIDGVAAIVGDEVVLLSEVRDALQPAAEQAAERGQELTPQFIQQLTQQALQALIDDKLIQQIAKKNNAAATDGDIDNAVAGIAQEEGVPVETIYEAAQKHGLSRAAYRDQLGKQLTRLKIVQNSVSGKVRVTDEEVRALYDERYGNAAPGHRIRVLHILIALPADAPANVRTEALAATQKLREKAIETGDFAGLARKFSAARTAEQGGLTVFREEDAPADVKAAIAGLEPGGISQTFENKNGINLFQFLDRFEPSSVKLEDVADRLRAEIGEKKTLPEFEKWIVEVRKNRYVEVVAPELK